MRVALVSGLWGRVELARPWWRMVARWREHWARRGVTLEPVVSGSEPFHAALALDYGALWVEAPNRPLGAKLNAAAQAAYRLGADYLCITGCDDFFSPRTLDVMANRLRDGAPYIGMAGCWFYDLATHRAGLFEAYPVGHRRRGEPIGAGRIIHRDLLPATGRPWDDDRNMALDYSMTQRCKLPEAALVPVSEVSVVVDVKTAGNIWSFDKMARSFHMGVTVDPPCLAAGIPEWGDISGQTPVPAPGTVPLEPPPPPRARRYRWPKAA